MIRVDLPDTTATDIFNIRYGEDISSYNQLDSVSLPYNHANGTIYTWYSVQNVTDPTNPSPWTPWFRGEPILPNLCKVKGYIYEITGEPLSEIEVVFFASERSYVQNVFVRHGQTQNTYTNSNGYWELYLIQGVEGRIKIPSLEIDSIITVPNQPETFIEELI